MPDWSTSDEATGVHVTPLGDVIDHTDSLDCTCGPRVEWTDPDTAETYPSGPLVVHHSLDGREQTEHA